MQKELARLATALIFLSDAPRDDIEQRLPDIIDQIERVNLEIQHDRSERGEDARQKL